MSAQEKLKDILIYGIALDIFDAKETYALEEFIGNNAVEINELTFGVFFGSIQILLNRQLILLVARLYEKPNNRYPTRSIPSALKVLEENADNLEIQQRQILEKELEKLGMNLNELKLLTDKDLTLKVVYFFNDKMPLSVEKSELVLGKALYSAQTLRNKNIAHPEAVSWEELPKPTYEQLVDLIEFAKEFVFIIGMSYFADMDEDYLTGDSTRSTRCLKRIIEKLKK